MDATLTRCGRFQHSRDELYARPLKEKTHKVCSEEEGENDT